MNRLLVSVMVATAAVTLPASAQTPPAKPAPAPAQAAGPNAPVPLPLWFHEIDTANKGEVTRAEFLKYRMKNFDQLDVKKDGKLTIEEFLKVAEPPFSNDMPNGMPLAERQARARAEFDNLDTNRDGFVERGEAEALVDAEFNQYDTDRDGKVTESELRLIVQRSMQREAAERQQADERRRKGLVTLNDFIDVQLRSADQLDKNNDGKVTQQEYAAVAGPADGPQAQGLPPFEIRRKIATMKFAEVDTNKDGVLDKVELTAHAYEQFLQIDLNKDHFLNEEEFKKAQDAETARLRTQIQALMSAPTAPPRPAPAPAPVVSAAPPAGHAGLEAGVKAIQADDMATAEKELQSLAKDRDPRAQFLLGLYVYGNPSSKLFDLVKGAPLLLDCSERGYVPAMLPLAGAYADGKGVPKSMYDSYKWLAIADIWNAPNTGPLLEQVAKELKPEEIAKAKAEALAFTFKTK